MSSKPLAALSATLLARKGTARPAMRPQPFANGPVLYVPDAMASTLPVDGPPATKDETADWAFDLGWNDMGDGPDNAPAAEPNLADRAAVVVNLPIIQPAAESIAAAARGSALAAGKRAAFTLRIDAERHLKLRLACTIAERSAQHLLIAALDQYLTTNPDLDGFAARVRASR